MNGLTKQVKSLRRGGQFSPCAARHSSLERRPEAVKCARAGNLNWLSPACSSFDPFRNAQQSGEFLWFSVQSTGCGVPDGDPNITGKSGNRSVVNQSRSELFKFAPGFFEGKARGKKPNDQSSMKGR
jgi:hypothetical protein